MILKEETWVHRPQCRAVRSHRPYTQTAWVLMPALLALIRPGSWANYLTFPAQPSHILTRKNNSYWVGCIEELTETKNGTYQAFKNWWPLCLTYGVQVDAG